MGNFQELTHNELFEIDGGGF